MLFDMDGLLVDSERVWLEVESQVVAWLGGEWGEEHQRALVGGSLSIAVDYMLELTGADVAREEIGRRMLDGMHERLSESVPLMPGAKELLAELKDAGVTTALVSSSHRRLIEPVLDAVGREFFALSVAGDEVARTKPDPEPYLTATARLGAVPGRCVVLEDSPNGVAAAEAAGCVTVAVPCVLPIPPAPGRTVVGSLRDLSLERLSSLVA
ncbi:HAD family hydrolase [Actinomadura verrucosospora]|uniref:HAD-superfamily hydrolase n=1 Tax=Actinomadura verrucosospora TaxID=46165 RepID=A0A7D4AIB8_ACTVE|nr:HAD family phosphatase [Actinomadura verrucosospora]QKG19428.1 HAD-superfamily hydrolase [Actinomadura verrucosospora]